MFIRTENEIISLMPTARWSRPEQLFGYLEEEERVALEPLLGTPLYEHLCTEYDRLRNIYVDITSTTIKPTSKAKANPAVPYADVTERLDRLQEGIIEEDSDSSDSDDKDVPPTDMQTVRLIRICQQIEFYKMLSHKAGLLTVSFNEGGGMNVVTADGYDPADDKRMERVAKDAWMSAGRAIDSLLLFLEADAKGKRLFTEEWSNADAYYLHKDLLFQTARVLNEYLDIKSERMAYVSLVRDIRFCQNTYLKPRVGGKLLKAVIEYANEGAAVTRHYTEQDDGSSGSSSSEGCCDDDITVLRDNEVYDELLSLLRTALAFYVESRRTEVGPKGDKLARRDSMTDAQQAMAMVCEYIEENLEALGDDAVDSPIYKKVKAAEQQAEWDAQHREAARRRQCRAACEQNRRKLFAIFPATHRTPEIK